jgi:hypothetical protein
MWARSFWREDGSVVYNCCWSSPAVSLWCESRGTRDHILLSEIRDSPNLEGQVPVFISPRNRVAQLYRQALGSLFVASYRDSIQRKSLSYVTTDGQSVSLSWCQVSIWGLRPDFYPSHTLAGLLMWGSLSDDRSGLPFTIAAGPRQPSHSCVRVPRDSWSCFTVSDLRLPQPGGTDPLIYTPKKQGGPVIPQALGSLFVASYYSQGYGSRSVEWYNLVADHIENIVSNSTSIIARLPLPSNDLSTVACLRSSLLEKTVFSFFSMSLPSNMSIFHNISLQCIPGFTK